MFRQQHAEGDVYVWQYKVEVLMELHLYHIPDSKVHGANTGPIWGRGGPGGPHAGPMNFAIWVINTKPVTTSVLTVRPRYIAVILLCITHERNPIARL